MSNLNRNNNPNEETLLEALETDDNIKIAEIVDTLTNQETLRQVSMMKEDERVQLISSLAPEVAADLLEETPSELAASMIEGLESEAAVKIMEELQTSMQADIVQEMDNAEAIYSVMDFDSAEDLRKLAQYETVVTILRHLISDEDKFERYRGQHPVIIDDSGRLIGVVSLRNLLRNKRSTKLSDIMNTPISVRTNTTQDELITLFDEHSFLSWPVTDDLGMLVGIVSKTEVSVAELTRSEQQSLSRQRVGDELRSMSTLLRSRRRLAWLSSNIVLNIIAASVISAYEETLAAVITIAVFLPMVSDMAGFFLVLSLASLFMPQLLA